MRTTLGVTSSLLNSRVNFRKITNKINSFYLSHNNHWSIHGAIFPLHSFFFLLLNSCINLRKLFNWNSQFSNCSHFVNLTLMAILCKPIICHVIWSCHARCRSCVIRGFIYFIPIIWSRSLKFLNSISIIVMHNLKNKISAWTRRHLGAHGSYRH